MLIYAGNLDKNGITTSLRSLMKNIDLDKRNYYISFCQGKAKRHGEQLATFSDKVNFFAVAEYFNLTATNKTVNTSCVHTAMQSLTGLFSSADMRTR